MAWQDIATAPKDGTPILGYVPRFAYEPKCEVLAWVAGGWAAHDTCHESPTHWQPLPPPPSEEPTR